MPGRPVVVRPNEIDGAMYRQFMIGNFGIGAFHPGSNVSGPYATIQMTDTQICVQHTDPRGKPKRGNPYFPSHWEWGYHEITSAQVFVTGWWLAIGMVSRREYPFGIRLNMGESIPRILLFSRRFDELIHGLESNGVDIDRNPRRLAMLLIGRK